MGEVWNTKNLKSHPKAASIYLTLPKIYTSIRRAGLLNRKGNEASVGLGQSI